MQKLYLKQSYKIRDRKNIHYFDKCPSVLFSNEKKIDLRWP